MSSENGVNDPFEQTNRQIFDFNNSLDEYFFTPVAKGWRKLPEFPKKNLANLAETAYTPVNLTNAILQFDKESISLILRRFVINLTFGFGGMYDIAGSKEFGNVKKRYENNFFSSFMQRVFFAWPTVFLCILIFVPIINKQLDKYLK